LRAPTASLSYSTVNGSLEAMLQFLPLGDGWTTTALLAIVAALGTWVFLRFVVSPLLRRLAAPHAVARTLLGYAAPAARMVLVLFVVQLVLNLAPGDLPGIERVRLGAEMAMIAALTWFLVRSVNGVAAAVIALNPVDSADNLRARQVVTQTRVLSRIVVVFAIAIGAALMLMAFPGMRQVGTSLLASAGVAGIVVGFAARPVLSNLIAGLQIALTQPMRIDDVLIVNGEWGRVEEIRGAYVVLRIWDERRLVIPLQWFTENPFENWTRTTSSLLGTVFLWLDFRVPLEPLRAELQRIVQEAPQWDGRVAIIQVTDTNERAMQIRVLVSATDSGQAFDLRCRVREGLLGFVQREYPDGLPRIRAEGSAIAPPPGRATLQAHQSLAQSREPERAKAPG
jgi:small-conductance mechanosensitive channel